MVEEDEEKGRGGEKKRSEEEKRGKCEGVSENGRCDWSRCRQGRCRSAEFYIAPSFNSRVFPTKSRLDFTSSQSEKKKDSFNFGHIASS